MKSLFNISEEYQKIISELDEYMLSNETDEMPQDLDEKLTIQREELKDKLRNYYFYIKQLEGDAETIKNHIADMQKRKKHINNKIDRLKNYVGFALELFGEENKSGNKFFKHELFKVTASRSSRLKVHNADLVPDLYKSTKTSIVIDNKALKQDLKEGLEVEGAYIDTSMNVNFKE